MTSAEGSTVTEDGLLERLRNGFAAVFLSSTLDKVANGVLTLVLTRYLLSPPEYGLLNFAVSTFAVVAILATLGLPKSAARYITEYLERAPEQVPHIVRRTTLYLGGLVGVVCTGLLLFRSPFLDLVGRPEFLPFLVVGTVYVGVRASTNYLAAVFQGFNRVDWSGYVRAASGISRTVFAVGFVLLGLGALGAFLGYVAGFLVATVIGGVALRSQLRGRFDAAGSMESGLSRRIVEYSVPLTATRGANVLDKKVDVVLVGTITGLTAVGYYAIAKQLSDIVAMPAASFGYALSPALGEQKAGENLDRARRLYRESLHYAVLTYVPACAGLIVVARPTVLYVFGRPYLGAVPVVQVFSGFILLNAINKVTSDGLDYLGRARARAAVKTAMAVSNFLLNLALIPQYGAVGAAAASVATYAVYVATNVTVMHRELSLSPVHAARTTVHATVIAAAMAVAVLGALPYVAGIGSLLAVVALGGAVWLALSIATGAVDVGRLRALLT